MMSEKFTIDDIHRIRYENFENTKNFTPQELIEKNQTRCLRKQNANYRTKKKGSKSK